VARSITRYLGAAASLGVGAVHAQQYYGAYFSAVPTIGTLFLLSFIGSGATAALLLAPVGRFGRRGEVILAAAAAGAIAIALGSLVGLLYSEHAPLFGFMEYDYRLAVVLTLVFDGLTAVLLGAFLLVSRATSSNRGSPAKHVSTRVIRRASKRPDNGEFS